MKGIDEGMKDFSQNKKSAVFFRILTGLCLGLIVYASLTYPEVDFVVRGYSKWFGIFRAPLARDFNSLNILKDIGVNILFYLPLGVLIPLAFFSAKPRYISPWLMFGFVLSVLMEFFQMFLGRHADALDILLNSGGYIFGFWSILFVVKRYRLRPAGLLGFSADGKDNAVDTLVSMRFVYMCVYGLAALVPFDISVSSVGVYVQFFSSAGAAPRMILDPLYHFFRADLFSPGMILEFLGYMPLALFTALIDARRQRLSWVNVAWVCLGFAFCVEVIQIVVMSQTTDVFNLVLALLAGSIGWAVVRVMQGAVAVGEDKEALNKRRQKHTGLLLILYLGVICMMAWAPYNFEYTPRKVADKLILESNLVPFRYHLEEPSVGKMMDLAKETGLFVPVGILMAFWARAFKKEVSFQKIVLMAFVFSAVFASFIELTQSACIGRYVDMTDVIMASLGGVIGVFIAPVFRRH